MFCVFFYSCFYTYNKSKIILFGLLNGETNESNCATLTCEKICPNWVRAVHVPAGCIKKLFFVRIYLFIFAIVLFYLPSSLLSGTLFLIAPWPLTSALATWLLLLDLQQTVVSCLAWYGPFLFSSDSKPLVLPHRMYSEAVEGDLKFGPDLEACGMHALEKVGNAGEGYICFGEFAKFFKMFFFLT